MMEGAYHIIVEQARLLEMHGIKTDNGRMEQERKNLLERIEREGWR